MWVDVSAGTLQLINHRLFRMSSDFTLPHFFLFQTFVENQTMNLQNTAQYYATAKLTIVLVSIKPFNKGIEKALIANYLEMATQYLIGNKIWKGSQH